MRKNRRNKEERPMAEQTMTKKKGLKKGWRIVLNDKAEEYGEGMASTSKLHRDVRQDRGQPYSLSILRS